MTVRTSEDWWTLADQVEPRLENYLAEFSVTWNRVEYAKARNARDWRACSMMFETAWANLPDSPTIRVQPFFDLCDLCSETWVHDGEDLPFDSEI